MAKIVNSAIGKYPLDSSGSPIGASRIDPSHTFGAISILLKEYIDNGSEKAWKEIKDSKNRDRKMTRLRRSSHAILWTWTREDPRSARKERS